MSVNGALRTLFGLGMLLMPFSTGAESGVIAFGLPILALLVLVYIAAVAARPIVLVPVTPYLLCGLLLVTAQLAATIYAPSLRESAARLLPNVIGFFVFVYLLSPLYQERGSGRLRHEDIAAVYVRSAAVLAVYFVVNFAFAVAQVGLAGVLVDRVTGGVMSLPWGASNVVASTLILPLFLSFALTNTAKSASARVILWTTRVAMVVAVAATLSRGAILSVAVGLILLALFANGRARRHVFGFVGAAVIVVTLADRWLGGVLATQIGQTFSGRLAADDMSDLNGRLEIWRDFLTALVESPLLGVGYYGSIAQQGATGHNVVLTTLVERGLIGFVLSSVILVAGGRAVLRGRRQARSLRDRFFFVCLGAGGFSSLLHLMFEDANFTQQYAVYSWVALATTFVAWVAVRETAPSVTAPRFGRPIESY